MAHEQRERECSKSRRHVNFLGRTRRVETEKETRKANGTPVVTTFTKTRVVTKRRELVKSYRLSGSFEKVNN